MYGRRPGCAGFILYLELQLPTLITDSSTYVYAGHGRTERSRLVLISTIVMYTRETSCGVDHRGHAADSWVFERRLTPFLPKFRSAHSSFWSTRTLAALLHEVSLCSRYVNDLYTLAYMRTPIGFKSINTLASLTMTLGIRLRLPSPARTGSAGD